MTLSFYCSYLLCLEIGIIGLCFLVLFPVKIHEELRQLTVLEFQIGLFSQVCIATIRVFNPV